MAVKIDKQSTLAGNPFVWLLVLGGAAGGAFYYYKTTHPDIVTVAIVDTPPPKPPDRDADWVDLPPPPKEAPRLVTNVPDAPEVEVVKPVEAPKTPEVMYSLYKDAKVVKPKLYAKGPDATDLAAWELDARPDKPFEWGKAGGKLWAKKVEAYMAKDARHTLVNPTAKYFPGPVADDAPRVQKAVRIPLNTYRWVSTGLYAPPGELIRVSVGAELKGRGAVIVGCHRDNICASKRTETHRFPQISKHQAFDKAIVEVCNPFGGLIYIDVPNDPTKAKSHATCRVEITGAVEAPLFVLGETTKEEWLRLRRAPAPWGEIGGNSHFATARTFRFKDMPFETAEGLAKYWDRCVDLQDWLCGWDPRRSPERMVADAEISAGSGHSGYPYMGYLDWEGWTDLESIKKNGSWGHFHEAGHNHQSGAWTFAGYGEVTNNVMGLYCEEQLADIKVGEGGGWLGNLDAALAARLGPPAIEDARGNLAMYVHPIKAFGWQSLRDTWAEYAKKGRAGLKIDTDEKKKETFVRLWSKHAKANLGPYFEMFGFPYTPSMKSSLSGLKKWMPENFPPKVDPANRPQPTDIADHGATMGDYQSEN